MVSCKHAKIADLIEPHVHENADFLDESTTIGDDTQQIQSSLSSVQKVHGGDRILVFDNYDKISFPGIIQNLHCDGSITAKYDDGVEDRIGLQKETGYF